MRSKVQCFIFQPRILTFSKKSAIFFNLNLNTTQVKGYTHLGLENIGQIYIWPIIMSYQVVSIDHVY